MTDISYTFVVPRKEKNGTGDTPERAEAPDARRSAVRWGNVVKSIQRESDDEPPRWLCVGWLPDGRSVELIAVETIFGWLIIHAMSPVQPKFAKEIAQTERRAR